MAASKSKKQESTNKLLIIFCKVCDKATEHWTRGVMVRCKKCGAEREQQTNAKVKSPFGPKGRGF